MTKCQKEERGFYKTQKHELQLLPAAGGWFNKNELERFVEDWPRRPPPSPDASGLPAFPPLSSDFLLLFHFLHPAYFSFFCRQLPRAAGSTSRSVFTCRQNSTLSSFFSFKAFSAFHQPSYLLPALAGRHFTRSILIHTQARASRSGFASRIHTTSPISFHSKHSQPFISHHTFFRRQPAVISPASFLSHKSHFTYIRLRRPVPHHQHQTNY